MSKKHLLRSFAFRVTRFSEISRLMQKIIQEFGKFLTVYFLFGKMLSLIWQFWYIIGLIFIIANGQLLKNNLTIWSRWPQIVYQGIHILHFLSGLRDATLMKKHDCTLDQHLKFAWDQCDHIGRFLKSSPNSW